MKSIVKIVVLFLLILVVPSCKTTQKFIVSGTPGTKIYTPKGECVGTIENTGEVQIELSDNGYYAYMLSKADTSDLFVPFALDYKKRSSNGVFTLRVAGYTLVLMGLTTELLGLVNPGGLSDDARGYVVAGGLGGAVLGAALGIPAELKMKQTSYEWQFKYLGNQSTNQDMTFVKPVLTSVKKEVVSEKQTIKETKKKTTKTFKNYSTQLEGMYIGSGTLTLNGEIIEKYSNAIIKVERIDNETVCVNVEESGALFFDDCNEYNITKTKNGYYLKHNEITKAVIKVSNNGEIEYYHPSVNIDDSIYTLSITATKQR